MAEKILIVDDEEDVLKSTEMLVDMLGYEAIPIQDPANILEVAERTHPGVILQDLKMKDLNVAGLMASLRSNPETADIPVVFFSASQDLPGTAQRYDAWGYLPKPFSEKELAQVLDKALNKERSSAQGKIHVADSVQREMKTMFHDLWNLMAALNTYHAVLKNAEGLSESERKAVHGLDELNLKLEAKIDRMRSYLAAILA